MYHCCFKATTLFDDYKSKVEAGYENFEADLDVIRIIRRRRLNGIANHMTMNRGVRDMIARLAFRTTLPDINKLDTYH